MRANLSLVHSRVVSARLAAERNRLIPSNEEILIAIRVGSMNNGVSVSADHLSSITERF